LQIGLRRWYANKESFELFYLKNNTMPSAVIAGYDYDVIKEILTVRYHSGKIYNYLGVPEKVYREMRATMVKGIFFNRNIKGKYRFEQVTPQISLPFK
jgi:KTSC domain-containing protein